MEELISVIVPIFKVEQFLPRCIESLLQQDYKNIEIILVDDGSPDRCGSICDRYAEMDSRVRVIHKKNGGLSDARNAGVEISKGMYIAFVDSDDWVSPSYLYTMINALEETNSDICECNVVRTSGSAHVSNEITSSREIYTTENALKELILDKELHQYVWNKLYRKECLKGVEFPKGKTNEDEFWTYKVFGNAYKVVKIPDILYYYFQREGSIMGTAYGLKRLDALDAKVERQKYIELNFQNLQVLAKVNLMNSCIYSGQMSLKYLKGIQKQNAMQKIQKIVANNILQKQEIEQLQGAEKLWIKFANKHFGLTCRVKNVLKRGL